MRNKRDNPELEDGFEMPPPKEPRAKPVKKGSRWRTLIENAKPGQSVLIPCFQAEGLKGQARNMGVQTRSAKGGTIIINNPPLQPSNYSATRVWFVNAYQPPTVPTPPVSADSPSHWDEQPNHPVADWRTEVANDDTRLGYLAWCEAREEGKAALQASDRRAYTLTFRETIYRNVSIYCAGDDPKKAAEQGWNLWLGMTEEQRSKVREEEDDRNEDLELEVDGDEGCFTFLMSQMGDGQPFEDPDAEEDDDDNEDD